MITRHHRFEVKITKIMTRCRPSKGRRCIPDVVFKNERSMVQTFRNINVHVVNTDIFIDITIDIYSIDITITTVRLILTKLE